MDRQSALLRSAFWFGYHQMWISYWSFAAEWTYSCKAYVWLLRIIRNSKEIHLIFIFCCGLDIQGVPKKGWITTSNSSSNSHFFWDTLYSCKTYVWLLRIIRNSKEIHLIFIFCRRLDIQLQNISPTAQNHKEF